MSDRRHRVGVTTREAVMWMQWLTFETQLAAGDVAQSRKSASVRNADFDLSAVTARTVVVSGDHDVDYFQTTADSLASSIPGAVRVPAIYRRWRHSRRRTP